jgi:hypothetical protein
MKAAALCVSTLVLAAFWPASHVPPAQRAAIDTRYRSFGIAIPPGGIVLPDPYATPYSGRSFVVPASWFADFVKKSASGTELVSARALRMDLPILHMLLKQAYPGYALAESRGWDWDTWFREWDERLARAGDARLLPSEAVKPWSALEDFQLDNHSRPLIPGLLSVSVSARLDAVPSGTCESLQMSDGQRFALASGDPGQQPHAVDSWDGSKFAPAWYVSYPQRYGAAASVTCNGVPISLTTIAQPRVTVSKPVYQKVANGIVYIRTPQSFSYQNDRAFDAVLPPISDAAGERVVVLDLRSNGGGAAPIGVLKRWYSPHEIARAVQPGDTYTSKSCLATALWFNAGQSMAASLKPPVDPSIRELLQMQVDAIAATPAGRCRVQWITHRGVVHAPHHFTVARADDSQTRVIALVDDHCGSDCEALTLALSRLPDTVIAGTSTAGVMGFSRPGMFVLPYSRVPFMLALARTDPYGDSRSIDGYGIPVDVLLATPQSQSMTSIIALAQALSH